MRPQLGGCLAVATLLLLCACDDAGEPGAGLGSEVVSTAEVDWTFAQDLSLAALQTGDPPRSRAVWLVVHGDDLYVLTGFARRETWPQQVEQDPIVLLRVMDRLYLRRATRVTDRAKLAALRKAARVKYGDPPPGSEESSGFLRMDPTSARG